MNLQTPFSLAWRSAAPRIVPRTGPRAFSAPRLNVQPCARRMYASGPTNSNQKFMNQSAIGPFTLRAGAVFIVTAIGLTYYFQEEKKKQLARKAAETATARVGKPKIGGPFSLVDQDGKPFTEENLMGRWSLVYFGFTNCPDICPEELDKMGIVVNKLASSHGTKILPVFITCDPARDDVKAVKTYIKDFIPSLVGLTGTYDEIKRCCKVYRVYFSTPKDAKPTDDYLVDHSIFFYLMDPRGKFVDAFGRSMDADEVITKAGKYLKEWDDSDGKPSWVVD